MRTYFDESYGTKERQLVDFYLPDTDEFDLIIWIHGGGLVEGSYKELFIKDQLLRNNIGVASIEYTLYPFAKYPEFIVDASLGVKYVLNRIKDLRKKGRTFISGQSAGAYITMMLCFDKHYLNDVGVDRNLIDGYISDSCQPTVHYNVLKERGLSTTLERIDEAAPLFYVDENMDFKQLLLLTYDNDIECRLEQNKLFYQSILHNKKDADVTFILLNGYHCKGSCEQDEKGNCLYSTEVIKWLYR